MKRDYELALILNPEVNEEQTRAFLDRVEQIVANQDGQIVKVNQWGRRRLAYPIERQREGLYIFIDMILTPETVSELERTLKVSEITLRHMMKKRDPKAIQKERQDREEREARAAAAAAAAENEAANATTEEAPEEAPEEQPIAIEGIEEELPAVVSETSEEDIPAAIEEPVES